MKDLTAYAKIAGVGYEGPNATDVDQKAILTELQGFTVSLVTTCVATGECAAVTGMTASDTIKTVIKYVEGTGSSDVTANYTACAGGMTCSVEADSNGTELTVYWFDASGA